MPSVPWYRKTTIYQIYPRSFCDSNGDGIGDIPGIISRLDHIWDLGAETIWCSPFFVSPQRDFGYDISNYREIAPEYGTLEDADRLIEEVHRRHMRIVLDMVMNHTSDQHPWFVESRASRDNTRSDWYIWRDRPNNWQAYTRGSGWHYAPERGQYYWASFLPFQPDLNYRNEAVKAAMFDVVRYWLEKGVDGFRLDMFNSIYKQADFLDNPHSRQLLPSRDLPSRLFQEAKYNINQPETFEFARELRSVCDGFGDRMLLGEVSGPRSLIRQFMGAQTNDGLSLVFDFSMMQFKFRADYFHALIRDTEEHFADPFMPVYVFSNHDSHRSIQRLGNDPRKAKLLHFLQLTVRGVPCIYYGEEIGMTDGPLPRSTALDPIAHQFKLIPSILFSALGIVINRDVARTPMQWDASRNAGFSNSERTWLPVNPDHRSVNVAAETEQPDSLMNAVTNLLRIRTEEPALHSGSLQMVGGLPEGILGYHRRWAGDELGIYMNFSPSPVHIGPRGGSWIHVFSLSAADDFHDGEITLAPFSGMILKAVTADIKRELEKARMRTS